MKKILVVEDEYYARKSIVKILQESDLDIQVCGEAENGMKAIELLEEYKDIALVITDIQMQKMGGLELASYLHKHIPEIDVLILTAFENFDYAREALRYNVKDYIVKPIYKENLLPSVKKVLEKQEEKSRNQEKIKNYYQWETAKNYFPVKTIVAHEELYKEFFSYNAIHQEEKFCIVVMQEEELVTDVELVNRIIQEKYRGFIKDFFFSKINEEYVMLLSGIECMDNELIVQEKVESMLSYFCTCKHMNITMGVGLVYSSKEKIYQSYNEALYALNQRLIQGWNRAYFYKNMDGYKARIGKEAEIKLESIVRTRKEKEINQVIHSILEDIIIKEESAQKLYMAVVEILKILGNYYAELYQDEDIEELKDIKVMFSRRYDLYKFKHIEELENYLKEMVIVICSGKENTKKKSKIVEEIVHYVENNYYKNISLRELAENKYFVNYSYCSRLFSQETGMNFSKYLIQYRLKKAKTLLENKDMESAGLWMLPTYKENPLPFEWDVVRMPMDKNQNTKAGILNWGISKSTKNPEAAWDLLKFLCGPEGNRIVAESNMALPGSTDKEALQIVLDSKFPSNVKAFVDSVPDCDLKDQLSIYRTEVNTKVQQLVDEMLIGKSTPEETQEKLIKEINAILAN